MELSSCVVFILLILIPVNRSIAFVMINSTSETRILFKSSSELYTKNLRATPTNKECYCGPGTIGCRFLFGLKKICTCDKGMAQDGDKCKFCNCGILSSKCYFENGRQLCECFPNSAQRQNSCELCDCGYRSKNCEFKEYEKVCDCDDGFIQQRGNCKACDCGVASISCYLTYSGVRRCNCRKGYGSKRTSSFTDDEKCVYYSISSGWRIATYIEGVIFSVIIIGLLVFICSKKANV